MSELKIKTNNQPRDVLRWHDLTAKECGEFDYIDTDAKRDEAEFVRYKGWVHDLHDMERGLGCGTSWSEMPRGFEKWDNYKGDSYFSGILIRWVDEGERVVCATYFC